MSNKILAEYLPVDKLRPFEGHPFQVKDDEEMNQLVWSIITQGVLNPIMVRPLNTGEYEVISGHRRVHACRKAGIAKIPALIYSLDRDAAAIALVDSNLHREHILPSEKAFAYRMKMDAMSRQGQRTDLTSTQVVSKLRTNEIVGAANSDSREQVRRYIRLTYLIPEILRMVDEGRIALTPAVELSYLTEAEQQDLLETMECEDCTPSLSQAQQMKLLSQRGELTMDRIFEMLRAPKPNQQEKISLDYGQLRRYFPRSYTPRDVLNAILRLVEADFKRRQQRREER